MYSNANLVLGMEKVVTPIGLEDNLDDIPSTLYSSTCNVVCMACVSKREMYVYVI